MCWQAIQPTGSMWFGFTAKSSRARAAVARGSTRRKSLPTAATRATYSAMETRWYPSGAWPKRARSSVNSALARGRTRWILSSGSVHHGSPEMPMFASVCCGSPPKKL
ncbi:hypothetical protein ACMHYB_30540 [Sorangium sp. So ce1128]